MTQQSINPHTGEVFATYETFSQQACTDSIAAAQKAFFEWRDRPFEDKTACLTRTAALLRERKTEYATQITKEMGKPITAAKAEVEKCAWVCEYYAEHATTFLQPQTTPTEAEHSYVCFQPLGVILAVMPWNFPFWQLFRCAAPTLVAGNALLLKHASNVPGCALLIEQLFEDAGWPKNIFRTLLIDSGHVEQVIAHPAVKAATLTGSVRAGRSVASAAGSHLKKTVLELGGSDAYLVLEDADIEHAAHCCVTSRLINSGQSCIAAKRFIVVEAVQQAFEQQVQKKMAMATLGDPMDENTSVGPLARADLRDQLHRQVQQSIDAGARCLLGGEILAGRGFYYPPTLLTDVPAETPAIREELFGPVAVIIPVADETTAINSANASAFGLGAAIFSGDTTRARKIAEQLEVGICAVNDFVRSDPRLPFGGVKQSGYGRELGAFGIHEFVNIKSVMVNPGS